MSIGDRQIKIINNAKFFLKNLKSSKIDSSLSGLCYFNSWAETPGYARLKFQADGWSFIFKFFIIFLKNILAIASHTKYIEFGSQNLSKNVEIIVLTWAYKENFKNDGSFQDRYFNENSKNLPNSYWILISMDGYVPSNLDSNIKVLIRKKEIFKYNLFSFIKIIISAAVEYRFSLKKIFHYLNFYSYFAKLITPIVKKELHKTNCRAILLPYEAQPFQNKVFLETKKTNTKIITVGYLHSLTPLPSEFIHRLGAPDLLLVHGESQIEILETRLGWPISKLILIRSLRFQFKENESLTKKIFLPLSLHDSKKFINEFRELVIKSPANNFPIFHIKNHPAVVDSKKHLDFIFQLEKIIEAYKDRFSDISVNKNISIFFGVTTAVLEALENNVNVLHICSDPTFQSYSETIWPNIKTKKIGNFIFEYSLISKGKLICINKKAKLLDELKKTNIY